MNLLLYYTRFDVKTHGLLDNQKHPSAGGRTISSGREVLFLLVLFL